MLLQWLQPHASKTASVRHNHQNRDRHRSAWTHSAAQIRLKPSQTECVLLPHRNAVPSVHVSNNHSITISVTTVAACDRVCAMQGEWHWPMGSPAWTRTPTVDRPPRGALRHLQSIQVLPAATSACRLSPYWGSACSMVDATTACRPGQA